MADPAGDSADATGGAAGAARGQRRVQAMAGASVLGLVAVVLSAFTAVDALPPAPPRIMAAASLLLAGSVTVRALLARRRLDLAGRRVPLALLAVGVGVMVIGQGFGYLLTVTGPGTVDPRVEMIPMLAGLVPLALGLITLSWPPDMTGRERWSVAVDAAMVASSLVATWSLTGTLSLRTDQSLPLLERIDPWVHFLAMMACLLMASANRRIGPLPLVQLVVVQLAVIVAVVVNMVGEAYPGYIVFQLEAGRGWTGSFQGAPVSWSILGYLVALWLLLKFALMSPLAVDDAGALRWRDRWSTLVPVAPVLGAFAVTVGYRTLVGPLPRVEYMLVFLSFTILIVTTLRERWAYARDARELVGARTSLELQEGRAAQWFAALLGDSQDLITVVDSEGRVLYQTPSALPLFGFSQDGLLGQPLSSVLRGTSQADVVRLLLRATHNPEDRGPHELVLLDAAGQPRDTETVIAPLLPGTGGFVLTTRDVSDRRRLRAALAASGQRDALTGLANREGFQDRVRELVVAARPGTIALASMDLNSFRDINDGHGHEVGDDVLRAVAGCLTRLPPSVLAVARLGGDEFGLLAAADDPDAEMGQIHRELVSGLTGLALSDGSRVSLGFATGYSTLLSQGTSARELMEQADLAMGAARGPEGQGIVAYRPEMRTALVARLRAEADLRDCLDNERMIVHYQPVYDLAGGRMVGVEALARMPAPDGSVLGPEKFISIAEDLGLVQRLGRAVLWRALSDQKELIAALGYQVGLAVNLSAHQLDQDLAATIAQALAYTGTAPGSLVLELTETVLAENQETAGRFLAQVRDTGCQVALDDFGTGYSSLSYLAGLPVDVLKIDRSFVGQLQTSERARTLVHAVIQLGAALGLHTVAEGVETVEQRTILQALKCEQAQGYLFARPMALSELLAFVAANREHAGLGLRAAGA